MELDQAVAKLEGLREQILATRAEEKAVLAAASDAATLDAVMVDIERREADLTAAKVSLEKTKAANPAPPAPVRRPTPTPAPSSEEENN